ncbi:MAG: T9SS type A sorting domain-containing protein, partial [Bacteroidales bacterium]|nr:T9SS type A sorting domain-containing protein [Bacteroidales bacterium]
PMQYVGFSDIMPEGHAWVCDGYDENDFLHFNWGYDNLGGFFELGTGMFPINNAAAIKIMPAIECDIIVKELISPVSQTFYEPVELIVQVGNYSLEPISNIPIFYKINDEDVVNEIITETIEPGQLIDYHFQQLADFTESQGTSYNLKIFSSLDCDAYNLNDTLNIEIKNLACSSTPFSMGFSIGEDRDGWFIEDANNDGITWEMTPQCSNYQSHTAYYSGSSIQADDWLFTKCIELNENKVYKLSFDYSSVGAYMFQNLEIYIGDKPNSQNMYQFLDSMLNFSNLNLTTKEIYFSVNNDSYNYIGFRCTSLPDNLTLVLDNIKVEEMSQPDIAIVEINSPVISCDMQNEKVKLKLRNLSSQNLSNFPISYQLNNESIVTEMFSYEILPNQIYEWEFEQEADLSNFGEYKIKVFTSLENDFNTENDTLILEFTNYQSATSPYYLSFDFAEDLYGCVIEDANNDNKTWKFYAQAGNEANGCIRYEYNDFKPADDWFFTSCLRLETNFDYILSFYHKIEANTWPENLKVKIGKMASSEAMNELLIDLPNLTNQTWQQSEAIFSVSESGFYYIGFQCYSEAQMFNLYLDDIRLDGEHNSNSNFKTEKLKLYPNPTNDIVNLVFSELTNGELVVFDSSGRNLFENKINTDNYFLNMKNYKSGVYFIKVFTEKDVITQKIIKN